MFAGVLIFLVGIMCRAEGVPISEKPQMAAFAGTEFVAQQWQPPTAARQTATEAPNRDESRLLNSAQERLRVRRILQEQIKKWRAQAQETLSDSAQRALEEKPQLTDDDANLTAGEDRPVELATIVRSNVQEVALQFVKEMRIPADPWEKAYVGRLMVALLDLAYEDQLAGQDRLLVQVLIFGPSLIRELPQPNVQFPQARQESSESLPLAGAAEDNEKRDGNSEAYLIELREAQQDAENRNAQDERIMWSNQALELFYRDLTALIIKSKSSYAYNAVIERISRQLASRDAAFQQTLEALGQVQLSELSLSDLRLIQAKFSGLARRFGGKRQYIVYAEVQKQLRTQSNFAWRELDFSQTIKDLLTKLAQQIEVSSRTESFEAPEVTPGPTPSEPLEEPERTPSPKY